jgi:2-dehydro-3-deoxyglucarate aldolase/4-hydroxy-2-oxoheptanedioate aldolase
MRRTFIKLMKPSADHPKIGTWISTAAPSVVELAGLCGFDWVLIDLEHGCAGEASVPAQLHALQGTGTAAIVRVGAPHADLIARLLDWGADGIMVPHVESAAEAAAAVQAANYPPLGRRGFSRTVRAHGYGLRSPDSAPRPLVVAQIESAAAVGLADEIARVEGVDALFVGPADLQLDLRMRPDLENCSYAECLKVVAGSAARAGKAAGILLRDVAEIAQHREMGFNMLAVDSDLGILRKAYLAVTGAAPAP